MTSPSEKCDITTDERTIHGPISLGTLIRQLERVQFYSDNPGHQEGCFIQFDFGSFLPRSVHSYRGYYDHLAVSFETQYERNRRHDPSGKTSNSCRVPEFLQTLRNAIGQTFSGWKGGNYMMTAETPVWAASTGDATGTGIVGVQTDGSAFVILTTEYCR
jgi:hypothetical protein